MRIYYFYLIIFMTFLGCNHGNSEKTIKPKVLDDNNSISINAELLQEISFFELFSKIELIPLETNSKSIIKNVSKIIIENGKYYVLDKDQGALFVFDQVGKFLFKIQSIGNGPGEYTLLEDFIINRLNGNIEVLNPRGEILIFDNEGTFLQVVKIPISAVHYFAYLNKDTIVFYSQYEPFKLIYFSKSDLKVIKKEYSVPDFIIRQTPLIGYSSPFSISGNKVKFFQGFSDTIYEFKGIKLVPDIIWNFGNNSLKISELPPDKTIDYYANYLRRSNYVFGFYIFSENEDYIFTRFLFKNKWNFIFYNKNLKAYFIINKFKERLNPPLSPILIEGGLVASINPSGIQLLVNPSILNEKDKEIFRNIKFEDNPILVKYYFKN